MDPQSVPFTPREDIWRFQSEMLRVQQTQAEHAERLGRLERRQDEDARVKSVWGASSPFPSVLGGTPQQVPLQQPADAFSSFDDEPNNLLGSLHLDSTEEPRRLGATSRANSVRFDESANQGHWSRSSLDLIPRTGSAGLGGHPMTERSFSHKSDGRQSSAAASIHSATSGRANSMGLESSFAAVGTPLEPPRLAPGLFILGSVPAIIRCWLNTNFKNDSLLYAAVCTGSYTSTLDLRLIHKLGFASRITEEDSGLRKIELELYFPEAVPHPASSRSSSPTPQLPSLAVDFTVIEKTAADADAHAIQICLGSDMLRAHNADILLSSNSMALYDDDGSKLSIPLVRPEDERAFKGLHLNPGLLSSSQRQPPTSNPNATESNNGTSSNGTKNHVGADSNSNSNSNTITNKPRSDDSTSIPGSKAPSLIHASSDSDRNAGGTVPSSDDGTTSTSGHAGQPRQLYALASRTELGKDASTGGGGDADRDSTHSGLSTRTASSPAIWSNWRRDGAGVVDKDHREGREGRERDGGEWGVAGKTTTTAGAGSGYQSRGSAGIKVLKPLRAVGRSVSGTGTAVGMGAGAAGAGGGGGQQSRFFDEGRRRVGSVGGVAVGKDGGGGGGGGGESDPLLKRTVSGESRGSSVRDRDREMAGTGTGKLRSTANPVGTASAFSWLNGGGGGGGGGVGGGGK